MLKFFFVNLVWDIWATSAHKSVDVGVAFDMFRADIELGKATEFNSNRTDIDFAALKEEYDVLTKDEKKLAINIYEDFAKDNYEDIVKLWKNEDKAGCDAFVEEFIAAYIKREEEAAAEAAEAESDEVAE